MFIPRALKALAVTRLAVEVSMCTGQAKKLVVIEIRIVPTSGVVTDLAVGRETRRDMVGIIGVLVVLPMTAVAIGGGPDEPGFVAIDAIETAVGTGQRKKGVVDIEIAIDPSRLPRDRRVAELALGRESRLLMIGPTGAAIIESVTGEALDRRRRVLEGRALAMASGAVDAGVRTGQGKESGAVSIPHLPPVVPSGGDVAGLTAEAKLTPMYVFVAIGTGGRNPIERQGFVAGGALHALVATSERKPGLAVIELHGIP